MKYKLISTDLDGTLLDSKESINQNNLSAMKKLKDMGVIIAANTGRTLYEIPDSVRDNRYIDYFICSNGAVIYNNEKKIVLNEYVSADKMKKIFKLLTSYETSFAIHENGLSVLDTNKATVEFWVDHRATEYAARNFINFSVTEDNFYDRYSKGTEIEMICCYFKYAGQLKECMEKLREIEGIETATSTGVNIEVFSNKVNKGIMLRHLCEKLGIDMSEVIAVGDSPNDISMLEVSGLALAAANGFDSLKQKADRVICHCEDGVMGDILRDYYEN